MGLLNKIKMRTYCKEARESFTNTSTSFYELNSKNVQYSISFSIEHIVLILILNVQYSIFNITNQYRILIKAIGRWELRWNLIRVVLSTIEVESRGISWNLVESRGISCKNRPVTIEVGFLSESDDEVEFL